MYLRSYNHIIVLIIITTTNHSLRHQHHHYHHYHHDIPTTITTTTITITTLTTEGGALASLTPIVQPLEVGVDEVAHVVRVVVLLVIVKPLAEVILHIGHVGEDAVRLEEISREMVQPRKEVEQSRAPRDAHVLVEDAEEVLEDWVVVLETFSEGDGTHDVGDGRLKRIPEVEVLASCVVQDLEHLQELLVDLCAEDIPIFTHMFWWKNW